MDLRKLKTLIDLVSDSNISELEITEPEGKVRIVKAGAQPQYMPMPAHMAAHMATQMATQMAAPGLAPAPSAPAAAAGAEVPAEPAGRIIKSPMVGTFYRSASPGAKAFVELGDEIREGVPVCIIEAMKIMNEIEADTGGKVIRLFCDNGQAVEFGQPLFLVE